MARRKKHTAEQVVNLLRQIEVAGANGKLARRSAFRVITTSSLYALCAAKM